MTLTEFFEKIDFERLVFQKEFLLFLKEKKNLDFSNSDHLDGIINLIDYLQDTAAEVFGEEKVFLFEKKIKYYQLYKKYLEDYNLSDDTMYITDEDLFEFVEKEITSELMSDDSSG